ncbi:MAG TPA: serine--tRNA ligase [Pseudolabrys sp.]|nr:serine--tRNA ligase [Pseudolabrys sp.]
MYDIKWIREHPEAFDRGLTRRGLKPLSAKLLALDETRRALILKLEQAQARRNAASKEIGQAKAKKDEAAAQKLMAEVAEYKTSIPKMEADEKAAVEALNKELAQIPNTPADDVPDGADAGGNVEHHVFGARRNYAFTPRQHFELGEALGQMNFELAAKLSGARFVVLQKGLARLERALGQFFLDTHTSEKHGYSEVNPPLLVRDEVMFGTAQLPKFAEDQFSAGRRLSEEEYESRVKQAETSAPGPYVRGLMRFMVSTTDDFWLIPTAEVPLTNFVRDSIVDESKLPLRLTACTPCFRAEAGAAGKDTRGMIRQHQFTKVELVSVTTPDKSKEEHERMLACAEEVLKKLDLHYRVVTLCTGDMGFAAQKTYDIEVWLPGQNAYREISSCSNCGEFQARRMDARYKGKDGKVKGPVHTLNGSGVAVGRALIAVMETYQQDNGAIAVPEALKPYMGGVTVIEKVG